MPDWPNIPFWGHLAAFLLGAVLIFGPVLGWPAGPEADEKEPPKLVGTWRAIMEHSGQQGEFVVRFDRTEEGGLSATLSLPTIDAWEIAALPVTVDGNRVGLGIFDLTREPDGALSGELPDALVPVYDIPFVLRRTGPVERPERRALDAPRAKPAWTMDLGSPVWAGLALEGDMLFAGADDGIVRALVAKSGTIRWTFETGGPVRARPTPARGELLVHSDDGFLYALDSRTGETRWKTRIEDNPVTRIPPGAQGSRYDHYGSSAIRQKDTIFVGGHDGTLHALAADTGARRWRAQVDDTVTSTPAVAEGRLFFGSFDGRIYALDAETGRELWRHETRGAVPSSPAVADKLVVAGSRSYDLLALDAASGDVAWDHYFWYSWVDSAATVRDGTVYVGSSDAQALSALDATSGELAWSFDLGGSGWGRPSVTDDAVYLGAAGVADYLVDHHGGFFAVDRRTGEPLWYYPVERPGDAHVWGFAASPAAGVTLVFAARLDGQIIAFPRHVPE